MYFKTSLTIFITILGFICIPQFTSAQSQCLNPNQISGNCTSIWNCPQLLDMLNRTHVHHKPLQDIDETFLIRSECRGGLGREPHVCCTDDTAQCLNPNQRSGNCISIYQCSSLLRVAARRPLQDIDRRFLRSSKCRGFGLGLGTEPHVCCTDDTGYVTQPTALIPTENVNQSQRGELPELPACGEVTLQNKIFGGDNTDLSEFPWLALLEYRRRDGQVSTSCGGSLINQRYIITAAHCVTGKTLQVFGPLVNVMLGEHDTTKPIDCVNGTCAGPALRYGVEEVTPHESYSDAQVHRHNDIALVRLDRNVIYSDQIKPICLSFTLPNEQLPSGTMLTVAGWGRTIQNRKSAIKQKVQVPLIDQGECRQKFLTRKIQIIDAQVCAGGVPTEDSCDGDSGGPLMSFRQDVWVLEGIISFGASCGLEGWPTVHTRVESYDNWIRGVIRA